MRLKSLAILALSAACLTGCRSANNPFNPPDTDNPRTDGERTLYEAKKMKDKGEMQVKAERLIADGNAKKEKGETLKGQGKTVDGEKLAGEGDALIREGNTLMDKANAVSTKAPTTQGS